MSKIATSLAVVALGAAGVAWWQQMQAGVELRTEIAGLRDQVDRIGRERTASPAPKAEGATAPIVVTADKDELAKLRAEVAALQKQAKEFGRVVQQAQQAQAAQKAAAEIPTKLTAVAQLKNAGKASANATAETFFWAAAAGDVDTLAGTFALTDTARAKADAWFAGLSEATRRQYGTPERLMALMIARDAAQLTGMQVLGERAVTDDNVGVRIRFGTEQGAVKDDNYFFRRGADGWRLVVPDNAVEKYARQLSGGK